jgi:hypothetical protein
MKKVIIPLILLLAVAFLIAVESDPSDVVGYVKYDLLAGNNFIALPMQTGLTQASQIGDAIGAPSVSEWNPATQAWNTADNLGFPFGWTNSFAVYDGQALMVNVSGAGTYYCAGAMIVQPNYSLLAGNNFLMIPLDRSDLNAASLVGDAIGAPSVSEWNPATQAWNTADNLGFPFGWTNSFATEIAMPLMVNVAAPSTWPATRSNVNSTFRSAHGRTIK